MLATLIDVTLYFIFFLVLTIGIYKAWSLLGWWRRIVLAGSPEAVRFLDTQTTAESGLPVLYVLAQISPFVGLMGTVLRIQQTLAGLSGNSGLTEIAHPVGAALHSTFLGLLCAIPAVAAYGLLRHATSRLSKKAQGVLANGANSKIEGRTRDE